MKKYSIIEIASAANRAGIFYKQAENLLEELQRKDREDLENLEQMHQRAVEQGNEVLADVISYAIVEKQEKISE
jgi:hypothetical protein